MRYFIAILAVLIIQTEAWAAGNAPTEKLVSNPKAEALLDEVSANIKGLSSWSADFSLNIFNSDADLDENQDGRVFVKGNQYKVTTPDIDRMCNGTYVWTIFKAEEEGQKSDFDSEDAELSPAQLYTIHTSENFKIDFSDSKYDKAGYEAIDLVPTNSSVPFFKIRLYVDASKNLIQEAKIFERNGTRYTYKMTNFKTNPSLSKSIFEFDESNTDIDMIDLTQ